MAIPYSVALVETTNLSMIIAADHSCGAVPELRAGPLLPKWQSAEWEEIWCKYYTKEH